jgi:hypothetical protein
MGDRNGKSRREGSKDQLEVLASLKLKLNMEMETKNKARKAYRNKL